MAKRGRGQPTAYRPEYVEQAAKLVKLGATDEDLANFFDVATRTIYRWLSEFPEFSHALKLGKAEADERVERSLYHRAVGYTHDAVKIFLPKDSREPVLVPFKNHVPPDTVACIFWLKNRRKEAWRDVQQHEHGGVGDFDNMTDTELRAATVSEAKHLGLGAGRKREETQH